MKARMKHMFLLVVAVSGVAVTQQNEQLCTPAATENRDTEQPQKESSSTESSNEGEEAVADDTPDYDDTEPRQSRQPGEVPAMFRDDSMLDESHSNQELGINVYTAPSISKIFDQLDNLPAVPEEYVLRVRQEKLSTEAGQLALELGYLMSDGFIAVRSGHMNDIKPIALELVRYGKALGVGEKMNAHSASLLENAEKGQIEEFKKNLASTQEDVNKEFVALRDPDLTHLIALGGWVRALEAATAAIASKFDAQQAAVVFYPDGPAYFSEILSGINPQIAERMHVERIRELLDELAEKMTLEAGSKPTPEDVEQLRRIIDALSEATSRRGES